MVKEVVKHELELNVPAKKAWELYGTLRLAKLVEEKLSIVSKIQTIHGDGGLGTIVSVSFVPEAAGYSEFKEKFTKIDNNNRIKEAEVVEGGYLNFGFSLYRVRFQILEKGDSSCIIENTIEYELNEDSAANASLVSIDTLAAIACLAKDHLNEPVTDQHL